MLVTVCCFSTDCCTSKVDAIAKHVGKLATEMDLKKVQIVRYFFCFLFYFHQLHFEDLQNSINSPCDIRKGTDISYTFNCLFQNKQKISINLELGFSCVRRVKAADVIELGRFKPFVISRQIFR